MHGGALLADEAREQPTVLEPVSLVRLPMSCSLFANVDVVLPHDEIPSDRLYRHTAEELPDAVRARHVLTWCAMRAANTRPPNSGRHLPHLEATALGLLASIQDLVVKQMANQTVEIPIMAGRSVPESRPVVPNPLNEKNKERLDTFLERERKYVLHLRNEHF